MRWLLLKDLQILRRSPLLVTLLIVYPIVIALLIGFALSRGPGKPAIAVYNDIPETERTFDVGGEAVNAVLSGSTPIALIGEGNVIGQIRAGTMTPLVMLNNIRSPNFPDVPTMAETGYSGAPSRSWYGLFTPAGTPKPVMDQIKATMGLSAN